MKNCDNVCVWGISSDHITSFRFFLYSYFIQKKKIILITNFRIKKRNTVFKCRIHLRVNTPLSDYRTSPHDSAEPPREEGKNNLKLYFKETG